MNEISGSARGAGLRVAVLVSRFNEFLTKKLLTGALEALAEGAVDEQDITVIWTPGSYELPAALAQTAALDFDAFVCLGIVVRGETAHFDYICAETARGISRIAVEKGLPVGFGVITAENTGQAIDRAGGSRGNKGRDAALAAIEMADLFRQLHKGKGKRKVK